MKQLFTMLVALLCLASCSKENEKEVNADPICMEGRIDWGGNPAADGSGWTFVPAETNQHYFLKDLPEAYKQHNLQVAVCVQETSEKVYTFSPEPHTLYKIVSIKNK